MTLVLLNLFTFNLQSSATQMMMSAVPNRAASVVNFDNMLLYVTYNIVCSLLLI